MADLFGELVIGCRRHLLTVPGLPAGRKWWDQPFTPTAGVPWLRETWRPVLSQKVGPGRQADEEHRLLYEVGVFFPPFSSGPAQASALADTIRKKFSVGTTVAFNSSIGSVFRSERGPEITNADFSSFLVTASVVMFATPGS